MSSLNSRSVWSTSLSKNSSSFVDRHGNKVSVDSENNMRLDLNPFCFSPPSSTRPDLFGLTYVCRVCRPIGVLIFVPLGKH